MYQVKSYDIEIFPNYALFVFIDVEPYMEMYRRIHDPKTKKLLVSESEKIRLIKEIPRVHFEISSVEGYEKNDLLALLDYCNQWDYLVGFNILDYDNVILNMLAMDLYKFESIKDINTLLFKLSSKIVNIDRDLLKNDAVHKLYKFYGTHYYSIDLQKIPALDKVFKGLKQTLINLKWFKIEEHSLPDLTVDELKYYDLPPLLTLQQASKYINHWHRFLIKDHIPSVIDYCENDVLGCCELFCFLEEQISLRFNLKAQYDIDVLSASDSNIADIFIAKYYSEYTGIPYKEYKDLRTHRTRMSIGKIISPLIKFKSKEFNDLLVSLMSKTVSSTNEINYPVTFNGVTYDIKSGGLHSRDNPKIYVFPDGSHLIEDGDVKIGVVTL